MIWDEAVLTPSIHDILRGREGVCVIVRQAYYVRSAKNLGVLSVRSTVIYLLRSYSPRQYPWYGISAVQADPQASNEGQQEGGASGPWGAPSSNT